MPAPRLLVARALAALTLAACGRSDGQQRPDSAGTLASALASPALPPVAAGREARARFAGATLDSAALGAAATRAEGLAKIRSFLVEHRGRVVLERYYHGATAPRPANLKSASKSVISALVGIAIAEGRITGTDQTIGALLPAATRGLDSAKRAITVGDLVSMRAGLGSTSFDQYGRWVSSRNWVRAALERPLVAPPGRDGGPMIYSTGNTHLLSAILARATGGTTHAYAARALARPLGIALPGWPTDPQGIHFGGNEMRMTPRDMLRFGALFLNEGRAPAGTPAAGRQLVPEAWVDSSWTRRTRSGWSGEEYGYGWWARDVAGRQASHPVYYAWGYGGQYVWVVPGLELVVVMTSDPTPATRERGHLQALHRLLDDVVVAAGG